MFDFVSIEIGEGIFQLIWPLFILCRRVGATANDEFFNCRKKWRGIHDDLVRALNEAKDNVKYLASLEKFYEPLYGTDPVAIIDHLPTLMRSLRNVYNSAKFYNTSDCMAAFLVKCTNQLIIVCRAFITEHGARSVFSHTPKSLDQKVQVCETIRVKCDSL